MADSGGCKCIRDCIGDQVPWCAECCAGSSLDCPRQYSGTRAPVLVIYVTGARRVGLVPARPQVHMVSASPVVMGGEAMLWRFQNTVLTKRSAGIVVAGSVLTDQNSCHASARS